MRQGACTSGEECGKALVEKAGLAVQLVVTTCEHALDLRHKIECPVVWLAPAGVDPKYGPHTVALPDGGEHALVCHPRHPGDVGAVTELLRQLDGNLDLTEPFTRIREAIGEARKMGVTGRAAA